MSDDGFELMFDSYFKQHAKVVEDSAVEIALPFGRMLEDVVSRMKQGRKIMLFGNGGSAADAQHIATELTVRLKENRAAIPALALTTDTSALTAIGNDFGFPYIFARQIEALGLCDDIALGISTSGSSENVMLAMKEARTRGMLTVAFCGRSGGKIGSMEEIDHVIKVPADETAHIQEVHIMLGHLLCMAIENGLRA